MAGIVLRPDLLIALACGLLLCGCDSASESPANEQSAHTDKGGIATGEADGAEGAAVDGAQTASSTDATDATEASRATDPDRHAGMVFVRGGSFTMGSEGPLSRRNEQPPNQVQLDGFWIDTAPVTNAQFARFVEATGYETIAERKPDWDELKKSLPPGTPRPDDSLLVAGSMVFTPSAGPVDLRDMSGFWQWVPGASWQHP
ncbi:MAG: formylglycine-generating enzyme family protein, partial [Planctomycetaceae bacterium]|nr:formylglycine-generating enzyme family protein [Planctomycetaceae bacterium]